MEKAEKWDQLCESMGWLANPPVESVLLDIYASKQGNREKYLKIKKLKEKIEHFFKKDANPNLIMDYSEAYATLGVIKGILFED